MTTILYARVSTADQTAEHQLAQARAAGFDIDQTITDSAVSGVSVPFADRPQARRLVDLLRAGDVLVVRWVDRLGRDYEDVTATIRHFMARGVIIRTVINNMTFDGATDDPVQKAVRDSLIAFLSATAQAQAEATKSAQVAGIAHAKASKEASRKYRGRAPSYDRTTFEAICALLDAPAATPVAQIARTNGVSRQTVLRIREDRAAAEAALDLWGR